MNADLQRSFALYLIEILHQTTTIRSSGHRQSRLYLIEILHQTTTIPVVHPCRLMLYLIEILHQTTTRSGDFIPSLGLYLIEILHQTTTPGSNGPRPGRVVSYRNSTSNHNCPADSPAGWHVVSYRNSTSNHNQELITDEMAALYLIEILHQTTTLGLILIDKVLLTGCLPL